MANSGAHKSPHIRLVPYVATHIACLAVIWVGISWDLKPVPVEARDHTPRRIRPVRR